MTTKILTTFFEWLFACKVILLNYDCYLQVKLISPINRKKFYSALRFLRKSFSGQISVRVLFCDEGSLQIFLGNGEKIDVILNNPNDFVMNIC